MGDTTNGSPPCHIWFSRHKRLGDTLSPPKVGTLMIPFKYLMVFKKNLGPWWCSGDTLASHLSGRQFKAQTLCGKVGSGLLMVGSLQYRTLTNCMYRFPLPTKLPIVTNWLCLQPPPDLFCLFIYLGFNIVFNTIYDG